MITSIASCRNYNKSRLIAVLSLLGAGMFSPTHAVAAVVTVNAAETYQTMDGFGSSERVFDDPHVFNNFDSSTGRAKTVMTTAQQNEILDKLYVDLGLTRVRPVNAETSATNGIEPINDNADPYATDPTKFNFAWKNLDAHLDYINRARDRGVDTYFLSPLNRENWMGVDANSSTDVAEYSEWLLAQVRRSAAQGAPLPYLSVANEPGYNRNPMSGEFIREVIKNLGPRLRAEGFDTLFVTPDDVRSSKAATRTAIILADPVARQYVGALATHLYDESVSRVNQMKALADQYNLPLWMTEFHVGALDTANIPQASRNAFGWASLMHDLISTYNVSAVDYLWGAFGQWEGNKSMLIQLNNTSNGTYTGYTLTKQYYTMGQFSRFIDPGAERIMAASDNTGIQTTAYLNEGELVIVAINITSSDQQMTFDLSGLGDITQFQFEQIRTSLTENWAELADIMVNGSSFTVTLSANSVTTFVSPIAIPEPATFGLMSVGALLLAARRRRAKVA